jgi:hypothetical protein
MPIAASLDRFLSLRRAWPGSNPEAASLIGYFWIATAAKACRVWVETSATVMARLDRAIHETGKGPSSLVDGRAKPGHDNGESIKTRRALKRPRDDVEN